MCLPGQQQHNMRSEAGSLWCHAGEVPGIKITRSAQLLLDKLMQGDVSDISDIEDSDEEDSTALPKSATDSEKGKCHC